MNYVAVHVHEERLEEYRLQLERAGIDVFSSFVNHDDSAGGFSPGMHAGMLVRSVYFAHPNGTLLEMEPLNPRRPHAGRRIT